MNYVFILILPLLGNPNAQIKVSYHDTLQSCQKEAIYLGQENREVLENLIVPVRWACQAIEQDA